MGWPLNKKNEGGLISSETFNLTRITTVLAAGAATLAAVGGATADKGSGFVWAGFDATQRTALIVAAVTAIALISSADIVGRAIAAGKAENTKLQVLADPRAAKLKAGSGGSKDGVVVALRPGQTLQVLFITTEPPQTASWQNFDEVHIPHV